MMALRSGQWVKKKRSAISRKSWPATMTKSGHHSNKVESHSTYLHGLEGCRGTRFYPDTDTSKDSDEEPSEDEDGNKETENELEDNCKGFAFL